MTNQRDVVTTVITNDIGCVVEVRKCADLVRCGECKYMSADGRCLEFADDNIRPSVSDYCSYGERRKP